MTRTAHPLLSEIPFAEFSRLVSQHECELDFEFLGFTDAYHALSLVVPKDCTIVDLGCYMAFQAHYFKDHARYIGVDVCKLQRYSPPNATHYFSSIQDFVEHILPTLNLDLESTFAICNHVPDSEAVSLVRNTFPNLFCYYPAPFRSNHSKKIFAACTNSRS